MLPTACSTAIAFVACTGAAVASAGGQLAVTVVDIDGQPVPEVAVYATPRNPEQIHSERNAARPATMDQRDRAFVPHILVVERGAEIAFPNSDEFLHHVYSFSSAQSFEFPLYGRLNSPSLRFDVAGLVTLGCNIHDSMLGYILVVDTPNFALTDESGRVTFDDLPPGSYTVETWTPRLRPNRLPAGMDRSVDTGKSTDLTISFESKLRPPHRHSATSLTWEHY